MVPRTARSSNTPSSNESGHSLPSQPKEDRPAHNRARPPPARSSSANPHRSSHRPLSGHFHRPGDISLHPALDLAHHSTKVKDNLNSAQAGFSSTPVNLNMLAHPPRFHSPLLLPPQDYTSRSHAHNRQSMQPSQSQPSFGTFPRDPRRETLQPHTNMAHGRTGQRSNRQSRHLDLPMRRGNEPANLIQSVRDTPQSSRPNSLVDSRRVVTGVLQSALPPSSRPVPVNNAPVRSMSIAELEYRHKVQLQRLQAHSNHQAAKLSTAKPSAATQSQNMDPKQRPKPAQQKVQPYRTPPAATKPPVSSRRQSANSSPKAPTSSSGTSSKSNNAGQPEQKAEKASEKKVEKGSAANSNRRSIFGFLGFKETKSIAASTEEPSTKPKSLLSSKKQKEESSKPAANEDEDEDEDVPLAQLANRRASYNPAACSMIVGQNELSTPTEALISKSQSVPGMMNKMGTRESSHDFGPRPDHLRSHTNPIDNRPSRRSSRQHDRAGGFQSIREDNELMPIDQNLTGCSDFSFQPPRWLDADMKYSQKQGPRPLIFEDEAKAIRNSKRFWS